ncbi:MAG: DUF1538 domain-containing protein [Burkholderiales bacterium]|nr:DUF1538 domain-containing protein [Burkholderiales bacterium]
MLALLRERLPETLKAIAPLVGTACVLQIAVAHAPAFLFAQFLAGSILAVLGMLLLLAGIEIGVLPMGRFIGAELPRKRSMWLIAAVAFALGVATTVAEPDVVVLANQVEAVSQGSLSGGWLTWLVAAGVGLFTAIALARVVSGYSLRALVAATYLLMLVLSVLAPAEFVPLAYDAGSVTTGVLTTPVLLSLALGLSSVLAGRSAEADGFGLLGLASAGPVIAVLLVGMLLQ